MFFVGLKVESQKKCKNKETYLSAFSSSVSGTRFFDKFSKLIFLSGWNLEPRRRAPRLEST